jgi:hypothetical protein
MGELAHSEVVARLDRIIALLEQLPQAFAAANHRGSALTKSDRRALAILLPAINLALGNVTFTSCSVIEDAKEDHALDKALGLVLGDTFSAKQLGKLLSRADGFGHEGLVVKCTAKVREGLLWRVERV